MYTDKVAEVLRQKGYTVSCFETRAEAVDHLKRHIKNKVVGFGDSHTLLSMNLHEHLCQNNEVYDPHHGIEGWSFLQVAKKTLTAEVFVTSVNAVSQTGELVSLDGTGNRVAGGLFGHEKVYFVVGKNKIVPTLQQAIWRTRNIAAPRNAMRLGLKTPCAKNGAKCFDCRSPDRICNGMVIHLSKMDDMEMEVVIIGEDLGY